MWGAPELALAAGGAVTRSRRKRRAVAATGAALVLMVGAGAVFGPGAWLRLNADHLTATGGIEMVHLPDGSVMTLNTASAVAIDFSDGAGAVKLLAGEAHFDVASDSAARLRSRRAMAAGMSGSRRARGLPFVPPACRSPCGRMSMRRLHGWRGGCASMSSRCPPCWPR